MTVSTWDILSLWLRRQAYHQELAVCGLLDLDLGAAQGGDRRGQLHGQYVRGGELAVVGQRSGGGGGSGGMRGCAVGQWAGGGGAGGGVGGVDEDE